MDGRRDKRPSAIDHRFKMIYRDRDGAETERVITVHALEAARSGRDVIMYARCHLRHGDREFRVARIREIVDLETGEISDRPGRMLARYRIRQASPFV